MPEIDLPPYLISEIENGNVVLMLGAGASFGTKNAEGQSAPMAAELAKLLANKFLSPTYADKPLGWVANYTISEATLAPVQEYVASLVEGLAPSPAHKLLTTFRWRAIVTTNYDMLIEDAYAANTSAPQKLVPLLDDDQNSDAKLRDTNALPLLKLHGCITQTRNAACPLVLSADSYIDYENKRSRLFHWFRELASDRTVMVLGYSLTDPNITAILERLTQRLPNRLRYYLLTKNITPIEIRYWEKKKI
ncbi:MAG TPA: SIR2 family protein [Gemmataceae bacterium]|nr:SIR2 family protein [Gemmataceae bacterium]